MRTILMIIALFYAVSLFGQEDIFKSIGQIRQLTQELKTNNEALSILSKIEPQCLSSDNDTLKAIFLELKGQALHNAKRYQECIPVCKESVRLMEKANIRQYEYLDALCIIATSYYRLKDYKNAEKYYEKSLVKSKTAKVKATAPYSANIYLNLGNLYKEAGDTLLANSCFQKYATFNSANSIDISDWNYIDWENSCWDKIDSLNKIGQYQKSIDVYTTLIDGVSKKYGIGEKYILATYSKGILLARYLNDYDDAQLLFEEVIRNRKTVSSNNESVCGAYCNLVLCYSVEGNFSQMDSIISAGMVYMKEANSTQYPAHCIYRFAGNGAYWNKNYEMAIKYYEKYLNPQYKRENGTSYEEIVNQLSVSYILSNKPKEAEFLLSSFLKTDESRLEKEKSPTLANIYHNLGRSYMLDGSIGKAKTYLQKSKIMQQQHYGTVSDLTLRYLKECNLK